MVARYPITLADPAARQVPRAVNVADQLVLVAPASADAASALAMTIEWLEAHGHADLATHGRHGPERRQRADGRACGQGRGDSGRAVPGHRARSVGWPAGGRKRTGDRRDPGVYGAGWRPRISRLADPAIRPIQSRERAPMSARTAGRTRLSVRYFDDRIVLTETHAWAYYRVPTVSYEFTSPVEREALATGITVALAAIRMADAEIHLRIAHRPYPAAEWATKLDATSDGGPGWVGYLEEMYRQVWAKDFWTKEVYLGVRLGQRGVRAQLSGGLLAQVTSSYRAAEQALGLIDEAVPAGEISPVDRAGRAARPGTWVQCARPPLMPAPTPLPGCSGMRWPGLSPSRRHRQRAAGPGAQARSSRCSRARSITAGWCCDCRTRLESPGPRSSPSPGSRMSCTSRRASRGCTTPTRCRSR